MSRWRTQAIALACWTIAAIGAGALWNAFSHSAFGFEAAPAFAYLFMGGIAASVAAFTSLVVAAFRRAGSGFVVALHVGVAAMLLVALRIAW